MLDRIFVTGEGAKRTVAAETNQLAIISYQPHDREIQPLFGLKPSSHEFWRARFIFIKRRGCHNGMIEDLKNLWRMALVASNELHRMRNRIGDCCRLRKSNRKQR